MSVIAGNIVVKLEHAAPYRALPQFARDAALTAGAIDPRTHRRQALLGLPARTPLFSPGDNIAASHDHLDAA